MQDTKGNTKERKLCSKVEEDSEMKFFLGKLFDLISVKF